MTEPILAVDFGTTTSAAILVAGGKEELIEEPSGHGRTWPSAVSLDGDRLVAGTAAENRKRRHAQLYRAEIKVELAEDRQVKLGGRFFRVTELITAILAAMRTEAERVAGRQVRRAVITVPASYRPHDKRRALMLQAAAGAGLAPVELLTEPVAAALAPAAGTPIPPGSLLVVYDYGGGTFDTALVRVTVDGNEVLGYAALDSGYGGRDIDRELSAQVERDAGPPLAEHTQTERGRMVLGDAVTALKHQLSDAETADDDYGTTDIVLSASRRQLDELAGPLLRRTLECVRSMLDACHVGLDDVTAVLMVGGVTRMPVVRETVARDLNRPTRDANSPELAVAQGAARFAAAAGTRFAVPQRQRTAERPLRWQIPGGSATLLDWLVAKGDRFAGGQPLGQVRLTNGAIWELRADDAPGLVGALHVERGRPVFASDWLVTAEAVGVTTPIVPRLAVTVSRAEALNAIVFSPDGTWLATAGDDKTERVWDAHDGTPKQTGPNSVRPAGLASAVLGVTAPSLLLAGMAPPRRRYDLADSKVLAIAFAPDGKSLAIGCEDGSARILDAATGTQTARLDCGSPVTGVSFTHDGAGLATSSDSLHVWDLATGTPRLLRGGTVAAVCASPVAGVLAAAYPADRRSRIIDARGHVVTATECDSPAGFVAFSSDGAWFASGRDADAAGIWDARSGVAVALLPHGSVRCAAFRADGTSCATAGDDGYARLWNIATAEELARVHHDAPVAGLAFSPDGQRLCTAGADGKARIWLIQ